MNINTQQIVVERVQTGVRMEKRIVNVLKALAEYHDITLGDLLEGIVLHAFEGKGPFGSPSFPLDVHNWRTWRGAVRSKMRALSCGRFGRLSRKCWQR